MIPKGYKHTELGVLPEDWEVVRLGDVCEINPKSLELPDTFIYIDLESVSKGKLCSVKYMKKTNAPSRAKRTLQKHDILFQMVRPYQKNNLYFILEGDYVASTGYAQIRTKQSSGFIFQYIHTQTFVERVIEKCTGSNYPAIKATDLSQIEILLPSLAEQEKIAEILSTWDTQIQNFETLITEKQALKKGLCQILLTAKTRLKGFSEDWEMKEFKKIFKRIPSKKFQIQTKDYKKIGKYPIVDQGKAKIVAYSDCDEKVLRVSDVILFGDHTREVKYINFDFIVGADGVQLFRSFSENNLFLYYFLSSQHIPNTGYNRHFKFVESMLFPLPPLAEQEKIAEILSEADNEITLLEQKLESLKSQKRGLMQNLLNGKVRVKQ